MGRGVGKKERKNERECVSISIWTFDVMSFASGNDMFNERWRFSIGLIFTIIYTV